MNKREKEVFESQLKSEKDVIAELDRQYQRALRDINNKIKLLQSNELTQSKIYQINYQKALKAQVEAILEKLHSDEYTTIQQYLDSSYTDGYVGTMYSMSGQGIPIITPIDQEAAARAIITDSKLSTDLYGAIGYDMDKLKKHVRQEITRGIASSLPYDQIARNIASFTSMPLANATRIVRTEGHRIQNEAAYNAMLDAKKQGADQLRQWDATLDGATRPMHRKLDGQIRELNEPFEVDGKTVMYPGGFGKPEQDCNCRCALLARARWGLDEGELEKLKERAKEFGLDKTKEFREFRIKYLKAAETIANTVESGIIDIDELTPCLRRARDGKIVNTEVIDISPTRAEFKDWEFDWTKPERDGFAVRAIKVEGDDRIQGMVALKADPANYAVVVDIVEDAPFNNPHNRKFVKKEYVGVGGHLFAEAVRESYKQGFGGFVFFKAKTNLIEHYEETLGAILVNPKRRIMAIDEGAAKKLYDQYFQEN